MLISNEPFEFHIAIYGLDKERYNNQELVEEIFQEINGQNIKRNTTKNKQKQQTSKIL